MYLDNEDVERRRGAKNVLVRLGIIKIGNGEVTIEGLHPSPGNDNHKNISTEVKEVIGVVARIGGSPAAAEAFGIHEKTAYDYARGVFGKRGQFDTVGLERIRDKSNEVIEGIREVALNKLMESIEVITPEKLEACKAVDASVVARNLAAVHEKLGDKSGVNVNGNVIFMTPRVREEHQYDKVSA